MLDIKVVSAELVTEMKKVWISCDHNGEASLWSQPPTWHAGLYPLGYFSGEVFAKDVEENALRWFLTNIEHPDGTIGGLPGPGEVWEIKLV